MKSYLAALAVGMLVGVIYALFGVRSPAPPVIALVGLSGMLLGEPIPLLIKQKLAKDSIVDSIGQQAGPHVLGGLPEGQGTSLPAQSTPPASPLFPTVPPATVTKKDSQ